MREARTVALLHRALLAGQVVLATVFVAINRSHGPLIGDETAVIGPALAGVAFVLVGMVVLVLVPRARIRRSHLSPDEYWADQATRSRVLLAWILSEGAAVLALVGFLLTGATVTAVAAAAGIAAFVWLRPHHFEGD